MQTELELKSNKFFLFCLLVVAFAVLISNIISKDVANATVDILLVPLSGGLLAVSIIIAIRFKGMGDHGRAYLLFAIFAAFWFSGEFEWFRSEIVSNLFPFPVQVDQLYLAGYPFLFAFLIYYLKPFWIAISKKILGYAFLATMVFLIPTMYTMYSYNPSASITNLLWAALYPISDAIVLFPAVLGVSLFFNGKVGLFWSLCCIAIILNVMADSGIFFLDIDKSSYSGNPINILYMWAYLLFAFGIYSHFKLFKKPKMKSYDDVEDLK